MSLTCGTGVSARQENLKTRFALRGFEPETSGLRVRAVVLATWDFRCYVTGTRSLSFCTQEKKKKDLTEDGARGGAADRRMTACPTDGPSARG